ncbi:2TM domain-containing protein [Thermoleptolyngbya sichuanensis XZ-Cy5]|nr:MULTISPECIES: 2TM domain-containing protein [Thermoleptolyngbya]MDG2617425.1 2TM domain-containing protein [Thermoleptolyngbya sichuanensis XZ-Cy5]
MVDASTTDKRFGEGSRMEFYSQDEVQHILQVAIARQAQSSGTVEHLTRAQLLEIAEELGISPGELHEAEIEWRAQSGEMQERQAFDQARKGRFQRRVTRYLIVNGFLAGCALLASGGASIMGVPYIALFWGMFLALDGWNTYGLTGDRYEDAFRRWQHRHRLKRSVHSLLTRWLKP